MVDRGCHTQMLGVLTNLTETKGKRYPKTQQQCCSQRLDLIHLNHNGFCTHHKSEQMTHRKTRPTTSGNREPEIITQFSHRMSHRRSHFQTGNTTRILLTTLRQRNGTCAPPLTTSTSLTLPMFA